MIAAQKIAPALVFLLWIPASAQPAVAPASGESAGPAAGENAGEYNIVQNWELGYRFATAGGDVQKYDADVNYHNGVRLFSGFLSVHSRTGRGAWFDEIVLTASGLGNDPYESAVLRIRKSRLYQYDLQWRQNDYFDPGLVTSAGYHVENFTRRWQDHNLVLFPQSKLRLIAGYGRNSENGPALSSEDLFEGESGNVFALFSNVHRLFNDYRIGGEAEFSGIKLSVMRRWEFYAEQDSPQTLAPGGAAGFVPGLTTLGGFNRAQPVHGTTPAWMAALLADRKKFAVNGRFTYSKAKDNFLLDEAAAGSGLIGAENRLVMTYGNAERPMTTGDLNVSYFPWDRLTITNNTSYSNTRISGNSFFEEIDLATLSADILNFQFLGIRLLTNSTDARYRVSRRFDFFAGYRYSDRQIRSIQSVTTPGAPFTNTAYSQYDHVQAGAAGFNWILAAPLRLHAEAEIGRSDNPFDPIAEKNYHSIDARLQYRRKSLAASAGYRQNYNNNSTVLTAYSAHARDSFANLSWAARDWLAFDAGYQHLHLDTAGGIAFFAGLPRQRLQTGESIYVSNIHAGNFGLRLALGKRADLYLGYSITRDPGDGRSSLLAPGSVPAALYNVQTFPLSFQSPLARLTVPIMSRLKWNAGYQYYGYREDFGLLGNLENYRANTGYTSLLWSF